MATGVLPVCLGSATKLCDMLADRDKEYETELLLGTETDTQDITGQILARYPVDISEDRVKDAVFSFAGEYLQVPPMYSALKVGGKKLYELARAGKEVERKARPVEIRELEILDCRLPEVGLRVVCSKGTYIRTLCHDIGERLSCGGAMKSLVRSRVGIFRMEDALTLEQIERLRDEGGLSGAVWSPDTVFEACKAVTVTGPGQRMAENGNRLPAGLLAEKILLADGEQVRVYDEAGRFYGIYQFQGEACDLKPLKMFL